MRRLVIVVVLLASSFAVAGRADAGGGGCHTPATEDAVTTVPIESLCFTPTVTEVAVGETVTWVNRDSMQHDVVAVGGAWGSDVLGAGDEFARTFDSPGTYVYVCHFHPGMAGAVNVVDDVDAQPIAAVSAPLTDPGNGDGPGLAGAVVVIVVLLASVGGAAALLLRRPRLG